MADKPISGKGVTFSRWDGAGTFVALANVVGITLPSIEVEMIEITNVNSNQHTEYIPGFTESGTAEIALNYVTSNFNVLFADIKSKEKQRYQVLFPDGASFEFEGYMKNMPMSVAMDSAISINTSIQVSGSINETPAPTAPAVVTLSYENLLAASCDLRMEILSLGDSIINPGLLLALTPEDCTFENAIQQKDVEATLGIKTETFDSLIPDTTYYYRAYTHWNSMAEILYGNIINFTTEQAPDAPIVQTVDITAITSSDCSINCNIASISGSYPVTTKGAEWEKVAGGGADSNSSPTGGTGTYSEISFGLEANTLYKARAFAITALGNEYGEWIEFTTLP